MPPGWTPLAGLDPAAPLDDLAPLADLIGDARVVAIGENAHFVAEFNQARMRLARFLAQRCGFRVFAYEFSFAGAVELAPWIAGAEVDRGDLWDTAVARWGGGPLLEYLRELNVSGTELRFAGLDTPEAGGTLLPLLRPLRDYLADVDPDSLPRLDTALSLATRIAADSGPAAVPAWQLLGAAGQDALTAALARLRLRLRALEVRLVADGGQHRYDVATHLLAAAEHTDYCLRVSESLLATGDGPAMDGSVRDRFMADSVRWHLDHARPGERLMVVAHNSHIQKTPIAFAPGQAPQSLPMGYYLSRELGADYVGIALAHTGSRVPELYPDETAAIGFAVHDAALAAPEPGSLEGAAVPGATGLLNLRAVPVPPDRLRAQSGYLYTDVTAAFDAAVFAPTATLEPTVTL